MPAKLVKRVPNVDGFFHIFNKGIPNQPIFVDENDYQMFVGFLEEYLSPPKNKEEYKKEFVIKGKTYKGVPHRANNYNKNIDLLAYSLSPNKFELLLEQKEKGSIERFMRSLSTRYSMYFNKKHKRKGSLFEGPYKSVYLGKDKEKVVDLTKRLHQEIISSYNNYNGSDSVPWIKTNTVLSFFSDLKNGFTNYRDFVEKHGDNHSKDESDLLEGIEPNPENNYSAPDFRKKHGFDFIQVSASLSIFIVLFSLGLRNISVYRGTNKENALSLDLSFIGLNINPDTHTVEPTYKPLDETSDGTNGNKIDKSVSSDASSPTVAGAFTEDGEQKITLVIKESLKNKEINIRGGPSITSEIIGTASVGDTYDLMSTEGEWYKIKLSDSYGYVYSNLAYVNLERN